MVPARNALSIGAVVAILTACGGIAAGIPLADRGVEGAFSHHQTFKYTGAAQTFTVPSDVTQIKIVALGGNGAGAAASPGGYGGRVTGTFSVTPNERLIVYVGGAGATNMTGGFNGGGTGGYGTSKLSSHEAGGGGGGASDVRTSGGKLKDRIIVAGGGGAGGNYAGYSSFGGRGGGSSFVASGATNVRMWPGWKATQPVVEFSW
jgi:hypothetical protein